MYLWLLRYIKGKVYFCICGKNKESVINLAVERGIKLWGLKNTNEGIVGFVFAKEYLLLSKCAREMHGKVHTIKKTGIPFYLYRYRHRKGMLVGGVLAVILILLSQNFIWKIDFHEYEGNNKEYLLSIMEEKGLKIGSYIPDLDCRLLQQEVLIEVEDISWLAFNVNGTQLDVEVSEKLDPPELKETEPCNIIAKKTGQIVHFDVYSGQEMIRPKDVVYKGELLVSGIAIDPAGEVNQVHADASVIAQTVNTHTISFSLNQEEHLYTGESARRYQVKVLGVQIPLYIDFSFPDQYDKIEQYQPFSLGETEFPFGLITEKYEFYKPKKIEYTRQEAATIIQNAFAQYEKENFSDVEIISYTDQEILENTTLSITREYICRENIAKKVKLHNSVID